MSNEAPKAPTTHPILIFHYLFYVLLVHALVLAFLFIQFTDNPLAPNNPIQKLIRKLGLTPKSPAKLPTNVTPPKPATPTSPTMQLRNPPDQVALNASPKVKQLPDQLYFISHIVDPTDQVKAPKATAEKADQTQLNQAAVTKPGPAKLTKNNTAPEQTDKKQLIQPNPSTRLMQNPDQTKPALDQPTNITRPVTNQPQPAKTNPTASQVIELSAAELEQLQKILETQANLLAQQAPVQTKKYPISAQELRQIKFSLDANSPAKKGAADQNKAKLTELEHTNQQLAPAKPTQKISPEFAKNQSAANNTGKASRSELLAQAVIDLPELDQFDTQQLTGDTVSDFDPAGSGTGRPIIRALAPSAYLRFANTHGQHIMSQAGRRTGEPTIQDLRKLSYHALVMRTFSDAFNAFKLIFNMFINEHTVIYVRFIIDPTGQVVHIDTHSDNAPPDVLEFVRKSIAYANPFPPLPKHLAQDNYIFGPFAITFNPGRVAGQYVWTQNVNKR